ncbi:membrane protein [Kineosporia sp. NBRC 101677]|uniref:DUF2306 domain-containing protein n=1 Tax=Kineosporia sp. NBRC 101677 TaxID=3032197 RepID=UPI0024A07A85|nr:DUF2306 domain-containing protein [Kineosporia sp. NBRC 101677]GLY18420.1 membrane protein [Kineosporia sp. NBRC 101677]
MARNNTTLTGLLLLTAIPVVAGATRLGELTGGARITEENARFFHSPVPIVVHIVGATLFCVLGAFQVTGHRRGHGRLGRVVLLPAGMAAALSGLWMTLAYDLPEWDSALLNAFRLVFGIGMAVSLYLGYRAVRRRNFRSHQRWMLWGYAIGLGAGTQVLTVGPFAVALGHQPGGLLRALAMAAGWLINLAVAEWYLRSRAAGSRRSRHESDRAGTVRPAGKLAA